MKNSWKRVAAGALSFAMVAGAMPANVGGLLTVGTGIVASAGDLAHFNPSVDKVTLYSDGSIASITMRYDWRYGSGLENAVVMTNKKIYHDGLEYVEYYGNQSYSFEESVNSIEWGYDGSTRGTSEPVIRSTDFYAVNGSDASPDTRTHKFEFKKGQYPIGEDVDFFFYLWTKTSSDNYYPDFQLASLRVKDMKVYYGQAENDAEIRVYASVDVNPTTDLVYNDTEQVLASCSLDDISGVSIKYAVTSEDVTTAPNEESELWTDTPTAKNAGKYKVWYQVTSTNEFYKSYVDYVNVEIAKSAPTVTAPTAKTGLRYTGKAQELVEAVEVDGGTMNYSLDGNSWSVDIPTATKVGEYKVWYKALGDANHKDTEAAFVTASIGGGIAKVTVPDGAVIEGQEATEGVYKLECGKTYTIYSDESLEPSITDGLDITTQRNKAFGGKTYNYKYTVEFADTITDGTEIAFAHKHAAKAFSTDATHTDLDKVWVYCEGEPSEQAGCVAYLDTNGTYYYGDSPTADDVKLSEYFGASAEVKDFYFTKKGDANGSKVSPENMKIGEKYVVNARIAVTIDSKVSNFVITKEIEFAARPLTMCEVFLKNGEKETKLPIRDGAVTVPANTFTYNGEQQKPEIVIRNTVLGTETTLTSADYTDAVEAKTNAGRYSAELTAVEGANYSGSLTVNWSIAKAVADIQITPKEKIVYDGEALDKSDFIFEGKNADLLNEKTTAVKVTGDDITNAGNTIANVKLTFENYKDINEDIPVTINKREVKVTPDADQSMIYGTEEAPVIKVETEKAVDNDEDGAWDTNTGVIPTDIEIDFAPTIDIADFDYTYFMNNAGTYSYKVSDTVLENYTALLEGTSVFTIKPKELTKGMFTVDEVDYTFDSKQKDAPMYVFSDGNYSDKKRTSKLTGNDFEVGGTDHAVLPGSYTLEFSGQGNYTGFVSYDWEIKPIRDYAAAVKIDSKTYDGKEVVPTSFVYKTDDTDKAPVKLPGTKTTYTYYEYDGESVIDEAYVKTLKALDGAPKDAGTYLVETTVTAKGYSLEKVYATFTINQKEIAVIPNSTSKVFGEADPDLADFTYDESAVAEGDTLTFTGEYAIPDYSGNAGVYPFELGTIAVDNDNYKPIINGVYVVNAQELTDANIKVIKECTVTEDGWWYPGDCIKVIGTVDGKEIELVRPVYDEESKTYTNTDFEFISATKTKQNGEFSVQVKGVGNYIGYAEAMVLIHDKDYDQQAAIADGVAVDIADAALKDGKKARFLLTPTLAEDWTVEAYGIIYDKTGAVTDAETAKAGLVLDGKYVTKTCSAKDGTPYALNVTPENNNDVWAVGYITVRKGAMKTTIYTEPKYGNVTELQAKENVRINLADAVLKDEIKARFVLTPEIAEGWTVKGYGIVYDKTGAVTDAETAKAELVLGGKYVTKTCSAKDGTAYALNITPVNDNMIWAVGYITVEKDGKTVTLYTEPKYAKVSELN